ncbi:MAG TPA: phosphoglycerate kinase [Candidatus Paceibacterota bacterium]|nr:phosphoglycerate kinase [Candidatus Paceibacterota bacterium]
MRTLRDITHLEGVPVLVRAALNVPIKNGKVANTFRLRAALPTIEYLRSRSAKVILIGHIGDTGTETLAPVVEALRALVPSITFATDAIGPEARRAVRDMVPGDVLVLENLRRHAGEKGNDPAFAAELASLADAFVQDSFDVCHREHASVVGVPRLLPSYAGLQLELEMRELGKALKPKRPALAIIGGAKFATKEPVLAMLMGRYDTVFVGGALANDFVQAKGMPVGTSLVSSVPTRSLHALAKNPKLMLPADYVVAPLGSRRTEGRIAVVDDVRPDEAILDDGPQTIERLAALSARAKTILWNGPLGNYENGFTEATEALARVIASSDAHTIIGGGDTVAAIEKLGFADDMSFISTGGGAMLDFLADGTLPGVDALL